MFWYGESSGDAGIVHCWHKELQLRFAVRVSLTSCEEIKKAIWYIDGAIQHMLDKYGDT